MVSDDQYQDDHYSRGTEKAMAAVPLVTVVTPVYNAARTLQRAVESVAMQQGVSLEHVLIDDGSKDDSLSLLNEFSKTYSHIKVIQQTNQGAGPARNKGIESARGRYIAFLDADDEWLPGKISAQVEFMERESCFFSYGDYTVFNSIRGKEVGSYTLVDQLTYQDLLKGCPIGCLTVAYNQECLGKVYMPDIKRGQDWALWLKLTRKGLIAKKYPGNHAVYYAGESSLSSNKFKKLRDVMCIYRCEENLSLPASLQYLLQHAIYVLRKNSSLK